MRRKKECPPLEILNAKQQLALQNGYQSSFITRMQILHELFVRCGSISLTMDYLKEYFPYYPCNRNTLSTLLKRHDVYQIALVELEKDVKLYGPEMSGCMDEETLKKLLWKIQKRIYQRCIPGEANETLDLEEEFD